MYLPVAPRSIPLRSNSSVSRREGPCIKSVRSVTLPTFIGLPASSKPFSCSKAFFASSAFLNCNANKKYNLVERVIHTYDEGIYYSF